jgi:hypothetical protein
VPGDDWPDDFVLEPVDHKKVYEFCSPFPVDAEIFLELASNQSELMWDRALKPPHL